jgi:hypothetical protein
MPIYFLFNRIFKVVICSLEQDLYFIAKAKKKHNKELHLLELEERVSDGGHCPVS